MIAPAQYFPRQGYISMPWRNGAGITREIAREPPLGENFLWRMSLASLQVSGPFSSYPGYQRAVVLVDGHGFRLKFTDAQAQVLGRRGEHALFPGSIATTCDLLDGPCTDLSLIVREPGRIDALTRLEIDAQQTLRMASGAIQALFVLRGAIECAQTRLPADSGVRGYPYKLAAHDTLLIQGCEDSWSIRRASGGKAELLIMIFSPPDPAA